MKRLAFAGFFNDLNRCAALDGGDTAIMDEEIDNPPLGLDHCGFIRSEVLLAQGRPPYPAAVEAWRETSCRTFAELLPSLYLPGGVVKGTAPASPISMRWQP